MRTFTGSIPVAIIFLFQQATAQQLYLPRNIQKAFKNATRSVDGRPGKNYWQNSGQYDITETVDPQTKIISGVEKIIYTNNSPDTLGSLAIRFVNNVHKPQSPRGNYTSDNFFTTGLAINSLLINDEDYHVDSKTWGTVTAIRLRHPLAPHASATLHIEWNYPLSKQDGREGQVDSTTFYMAYSYPRISVYDDYDGWDLLPHNGRQEFYNDFNDYQLAVIAPKDFVVWATGDLLNPDEVLQPAIAARLKQSMASDEVVTVASLADVQRKQVTAQADWNTWKFSSSHISDVCIAVSKNFVWDAGSVVVDKVTNRRASVQAAYNDTSRDYHSYVKWAKHSLAYFSAEWPGVSYPFPKMTSFQGHADMEYPMMINDATAGDLEFAQMVQDHEIAHTYFPFYMGINETRYAFMDEGWATTLEYLIGQDEFGKAHADSVYKKFRIQRYIADASGEEDQPIISMSTQVSGAGYGNNSYGKASLSYLALKDLLGDALFKKALHHYMDEWHGKHPIPWDYFNCMSSGAGQNLNWFFNNWFFSNYYIDLKIKEVNKENGRFLVTVENVGGFAIPFDVVATRENGTTDTIHQSPATWQKNEKMQVIALPAGHTLRSIVLDGGIFMDFTPEDNRWVADSLKR